MGVSVGSKRPSSSSLSQSEEKARKLGALLACEPLNSRVMREAVATHRASLCLIVEQETPWEPVVGVQAYHKYAIEVGRLGEDDSNWGPMWDDELKRQLVMSSDPLEETDEGKVLLGSRLETWSKALPVAQAGAAPMDVDQGKRDGARKTDPPSCFLECRSTEDLKRLFANALVPGCPEPNAVTTGLRWKDLKEGKEMKHLLKIMPGTASVLDQPTAPESPLKWSPESAALCHQFFHLMSPYAERHGEVLTPYDPLRRSYWKIWSSVGKGVLLGEGPGGFPYGIVGEKAFSGVPVATSIVGTSTIVLMKWRSWTGVLSCTWVPLSCLVPYCVEDLLDLVNQEGPAPAFRATFSQAAEEMGLERTDNAYSYLGTRHPWCVGQHPRGSSCWGPTV